MGRIEAGKAVHFDVRCGVIDAVVPLGARAGSVEIPRRRTTTDSERIRDLKGDLIDLDQWLLQCLLFLIYVDMGFTLGGLGDPYGFAAVTFAGGVKYRDVGRTNKLRNELADLGFSPIDAALAGLAITVLRHAARSK